jgi:hypothetical protein
MSKAKRHSSNLTSSFELPDKQKLAIADKDLETHRTPAMSPSGPSRQIVRCSDTSGIWDRADIARTVAKCENEPRSHLAFRRRLAQQLRQLGEVRRHAAGLRSCRYRHSH